VRLLCGDLGENRRGSADASSALSDRLKRKAVPSIELHRTFDEALISDSSTTNAALTPNSHAVPVKLTLKVKDLS